MKRQTGHLPSKIGFPAVRCASAAAADHVENGSVTVVNKLFSEIGGVFVALAGLLAASAANAAWTFTGVQDVAPNLSRTESSSGPTVILVSVPYAATSASSGVLGGGSKPSNTATSSAGPTLNTKWFSTASTLSFYASGTGLLGNLSYGGATAKPPTDHAEGLLLQFSTSVTLNCFSTAQSASSLAFRCSAGLIPTQRRMPTWVLPGPT